MACEAVDVLDVLTLLERAEVAVALDGGWGVDALLGEQFRDHDDVDLLVDEAEVDRVIALLEGVGFVVQADERPSRVALTDRWDRSVDLHPLSTGPDGVRRRQRGGADGSDLAYPADQLTTGFVGGRPVRCIDAHLQVAHHAGYPLGRRDLADLERLRDRFGVSLPDGYW